MQTLAKYLSRFFVVCGFLIVGICAVVGAPIVVYAVAGWLTL